MCLKNPRLNVDRGSNISGQNEFSGLDVIVINTLWLTVFKNVVGQVLRPAVPTYNHELSTRVFGVKSLHTI